MTNDDADVKKISAEMSKIATNNDKINDITILCIIIIQLAINNNVSINSDGEHWIDNAY